MLECLESRDGKWAIHWRFQLCTVMYSSVRFESLTVRFSYANIRLITLHCVCLLTDRFFWQCHRFICILLWWNNDEWITDYSWWTFIVPALCSICRSLNWRLAFHGPFSWCKLLGWSRKHYFAFCCFSPVHKIQIDPQNNIILVV